MDMAHWDRILKWLNTPPNTIRYDSDADRVALATETALAVAKTRAELKRLRLTETEEQKAARERRRLLLAKTTKALPLRMRIGDMELEPPSMDEPKDSEQCLLDVERRPWPPPISALIDQLLAEIDAQ